MIEGQDISHCIGLINLIGINTSKLIEATNRRGGFEISVIYIFKKVTPFIAKKRVCPIYM